MTTFVSYGVLWLDVDPATGLPGTVVHPGEDVPASVSPESIDWMATHGYTFDPMPDAAIAQAEALEAAAASYQAAQQPPAPAPAPAAESDPKPTAEPTAHPA